jgi:hypothetical protein
MSDYLDFSTAQAALHSIAEAYRRKDIAGAVACKDFETEARLMLRRIGKFADDHEVLRQTAEVLELSFRSHTQKAWPNFAGVSSALAELTHYQENVFIAREVGTYAGRRYEQAMYVAKTKDGWKVLNPVPAAVTRPWWKFW